MRLILKYFRLVVILGVLFVAAYYCYFAMARSDLGVPSAYWQEALRWLKGNTPNGAMVVAWWDYGYWIEYLADREPYLNPSENAERIREVSNYFLDRGDVRWEGFDDFYLIIDGHTVNNLRWNVVMWAGQDPDFVNFDESLMLRLYNQETVSGYKLRFNNDEIRIYEVRH